MFSLLSAFVLAVLTAISVNAHGYVQDVAIGTTHYTGYLPYSDPYYSPPPERIIRAIPGNGTYCNIRCHFTSSKFLPILGPVTDLSLIEQVLRQCHLAKKAD